jgi:hypothetical protein
MKALHLFLAANLLALTPCISAKEQPKKQKKDQPPAGHVFAWPFIESKEMMPRGGSTEGADVTLLTGSKEAWKKLNEPGLAKFEQDRRAILAMAGSYRVSFDFTESLGLTENFKPARPYFSWATENVTVLEDRGEFISLQHSLVMYFKNDKGETEGPAVMKHWRQDWTYQPKELHIFIGNRTWQRTPAANADDRWSQAVFQVDDSPRYEVLGRWTHDGVLHEWRSDNCPRPLPRREQTVRTDYNVLEGFHDITITPNGWVHLQNNRKLQVDPDGRRTYLGAELGVDRYEEITAPDLATAFNQFWEKTGGYWKDVRDTWAGILKENDRFALKNEADGDKLYAVHFEYAGELEKSGQPADPAANLKHAQETIHRFLEPAAAEAK